MKRDVGILSPDKSITPTLKVDIRSNYEIRLVESEQFTVSPLIFRGSKRPIQVYDYNGASPGL